MRYSLNGTEESSWKISVLVAIADVPSSLCPLNKIHTNCESIWAADHDFVQAAQIVVI